MKIYPGQPYPLGATYDGAGTNFSLFSEGAERVECRHETLAVQTWPTHPFHQCGIKPTGYHAPL